MAMAFDPKQVGRLDWRAQHVYNSPECQVTLSLSMETTKPGRYVMEHNSMWGQIITGPNITTANLQSSIRAQLDIGERLCLAGAILPGACAYVYQEVVNRRRRKITKQFGDHVINAVSELMGKEGSVITLLHARTTLVHRTVKLNGKKLWTSKIMPHQTLRPRTCNCTSFLFTLLGCWCCGSCGLETPCSHLGQFDDMHLIVDIQTPSTEEPQGAQC
eukprot:GILK01008609.1.p1 GENE.GILK01008609.1~~GILK01008609.1.p1  ORF type:complete len:238 (-),score=11.06 GILK01008609.1:121-771(-)